MDNTAINRYITTFRNKFGEYLKPGVGIQVRYSFLPDSVAICFTCGVGIVDGTKQEGMSLNMVAALNRFGLRQNSNVLEDTPGAKVFIQSRKFVLIKDNDFINDEMAVRDAIKIVDYIRGQKKQ